MWSVAAVSVAGMLRDRREVWRGTDTPDGMGGSSRVFALVGTVRCKVDIPGSQELERADRWEAEHTHNVFLLASADVRRGDELRGGALVLRVLSVVQPSSPVYRKALCSADQKEG